MSIIVYLMKTTIVFVTLFSLYNVFFRGITFLRLRRWYLNATLVLSFLIPSISPHILPCYYHPEHGSVLAWLNDAARQFIATSWLTEPSGDHLINILIITLFGISFAFVTVKYIISVVGMCKFLKNSPVIAKDKDCTLRTGHKGEGCFCFLKTIYLHSPSLNEQNVNIILAHEKAHIHQKHYVDMWILAICDYFFWFYPLIKQFKRAWEEVLECLADREAIHSLQIKPIVYQSALYSNMEYSSMQPFLNSAFGRSMIAQRLLFISKKPSSTKKILLKLGLPVLSICMLTTCLALMDIQIFQLQKINLIRNAGYELNEVTTGFVLDSDTGKPINNVIIQPETEDAFATTDKDGFFYIEKSTSKLKVLHVAYSKKNTTASNNLIITIEPSIHTITAEQLQQHKRLNKSREKIMATASFSGKDSYYDYIAKNMKYPERELIHKINGTVWVTAEIDSDGSVGKVQLQQGVNSDDLNDEAIRLVKNMPKWDPARQNNICTKVQVLLPVSFN